MKSRNLVVLTVVALLLATSMVTTVQAEKPVEW